MSNDGGMLSQDEIDSLFKQATGKNIAQPPTAPRDTYPSAASPVTPSTRPQQGTQPKAPSAAPLPTSAPVPSYEVLETLQATVADLAQRMTKLETAISRLGREEREVPDVSVTVQGLSQRLGAVVKDLQKVNSQVRATLRGLGGTPVYSIRSKFTCESCGSHGSVAIPMRCTKCGKEGWYGWWPKKE